MGSMLSFINAVRLSDMDAGAKTEQRLGDLRERAHDLEKRTGNGPMSWAEFSKAQPKEDGHPVRNFFIGAAVAAGVVLAVGAILSAPLLSLAAPAISLGLAGGIAGAFFDTENTRRSGMVNKYEHYLNDFEVTGGHAHVRAQEQAAGKTTHAAELAKGQGVAQGMGRS